MSPRRLLFQSGLFSIVLHLALLGMLVLSFDFVSRPLLPAPATEKEVVKAVTVDNAQVQQELQKIRDAENEKLKKQQALEKKLKDLENQAASVEKQRKAEEQRLAETKRKQEQEKKQREAEQKKLAQLKQEQQELEKKRQLEDQKRKAEEAERKRREEAAAAEKKRKEEEQQRAEEERKRKAAEEARKKQLAEEQRQREAAQARQDQALLQNIALKIKQSVEGNFNKSGLPPGLECELTVRTVPGGEVVSVSVSKSSGNDIFDRRAIAAVEKASPLPLPEDAATFNRLQLRQFAFLFRP